MTGALCVNSCSEYSNYLLNQLIWLKQQIAKSSDVDETVTDQLSSMLAEAKDLIEKLSSVQNIDEDEIKNSVRPQKQ